MRGIGTALVAVGLAACGRVGFDPTDPLGPEGMDWTARRELRLDTSTLPELSEVPVLVALDSTRIDYAAAGADGSGLSFTDTDGTTLLAHELERWDPQGRSIVWVNVPQLTPAEDSIWMYYGGRAPADVIDPTTVWSSEVGVWHLDDLPAGGTPARDSTSSANPLTPSGLAADGRIASPLGFGYRFDGIDDFLFASDDPALRMDQATSMTLSAWVRARTDTLGNVFRYDDNDIADGDSMVSRAVYALRIEPGAELSWFCGPAAATSGSRVGGVVIGTWQWVTIVREAATADSIYIDGTLARTTPNTAIGTWETTGQYLIVGRYLPTVGPEFFDGDLDELRIARQAQSPGWIRAQYLSMTDALVSFQPEERRPE